MNLGISSVEELLSKLISLGSVNPAFVHPGLDAGMVGEERCALWVESYLQSLGAETEMQWVEAERPNILGRFPSDRPGKPVLLFAPHLDTVGVEGMTIEPFSGEVRDGAIWGRGASDTKGSVAAMLWALRQCVAEIPALPYEVHFVGLANEECAQGGAAAYVKSYRADFVVVGEPSSLEAVHAHKGIARMRFTTRGRSAHASQPTQGVNAIDAMARVIAWFQPWALKQLAQWRCPDLGGATVSLGQILGGNAVNVIPDRCDALFDMRLVPGQCEREWKATVEAIGRQVEPSLEVTIERWSPAMNTDTSHPMICKLGELGAPLASTACYSDAGVFSAAGIAAVTIGPGSVAQAHTADEHLRVADLRAGADFFERFLRSLR